MGIVEHKNLGINPKDRAKTGLSTPESLAHAIYEIYEDKVHPLRNLSKKLHAWLNEYESRPKHR